MHFLNFSGISGIRGISAIGLGVIAAFCLAACGGGGSSSSTATTTYPGVTEYLSLSPTALLNYSAAHFARSL